MLRKKFLVISVFTDGACLGNPGRGGWAAKIRYPCGRTDILRGAVEHTTNNRMELTAAVKALEALQAFQKSSPKSSPKEETILLHSDSRYLVSGMNAWVAQWQKRGWRTAAKKPVLNKDLWQKLLTLANSLQPQPQFRWVKGHDGIPDNEEVDRQAQEAAQKIEKN